MASATRFQQASSALAATVAFALVALPLPARALAAADSFDWDASSWLGIPQDLGNGNRALSEGNCTFDSDRILATWDGPVRAPRRALFPPHYTAKVSTRNIAFFPPVQGGVLSLIRSTTSRITFDYTRVVHGKPVPSFVRHASVWVVPLDTEGPPYFLDKLVYLRRGTASSISVNESSCVTVDVGVGPLRRDAFYDGQFCGRYLFDVEGTGPMWVDQWYKDNHEAWVNPVNGDVVRLTAGEGSHFTYYDYDYSKPPESIFSTPPQCRKG